MPPSSSRRMKGVSVDVVAAFLTNLAEGLDADRESAPDHGCMILRRRVGSGGPSTGTFADQILRETQPSPQVPEPPRTTVEHTGGPAGGSRSTPHKSSSGTSESSQRTSATLPRVITCARKSRRSARVRLGGCHQTYFLAMACARRSFTSRSSSSVWAELKSTPIGPREDEYTCAAGLPGRSTTGPPGPFHADRAVVRRSTSVTQSGISSLERSGCPTMHKYNVRSWW